MVTRGGVLSLALVALSIAWALAPGALATTVTPSANTLTVADSDILGAGEENEIMVAVPVVDGDFEITDPRAGISSVSPPCTAVSSIEATCPNSGNIDTVLVDLGPQNDSARLDVGPAPPGGSTQIRGGSGKDVESGSSGPDLLSGGVGKDKLKGRAGDDLLQGGKQKDECAGGSGTDVARSCELVKSIP